MPELVMTESQHNICNECWDRKNPAMRPMRLAAARTERCCFCGQLNSDGIYLRQDPKTLPCKGIHKPLMFLGEDQQ